MPPPTPVPASDDAAERLAVVVDRVRWIAVHSAGRALLRRLELEDLVQETLLRAWQAREQWPAREPGETALARWMAVVVRRTAVDAARAARSRKRDGREQRLEPSDFSRTSGGQELPAQTAGPATRASYLESRAALEQAFLRLSGEHRQVLALRQFAGLNAAESAKRLGKSEVAVHSLFRRALQAWQREAGGVFPDSGDESTAGARLSLP